MSCGLVFGEPHCFYPGYGNIAPRTSSGQMFCMVYTVFGLALMMLFLANIGNMLARAIKTGYSRLLCRWCRVRRRWSQHPEGATSPPDRIKQDIVGPEVRHGSDIQCLL